MTAETKPRKSLLRRAWRMGVVAVVLVAALLAGVPYLLSTPLVTRWVLPRVFADVHGTVSADRLDFGWFSAPHISGFQIRSLDGEPVVSVNSITAEQPLWQLVSHPAEIGHVTVDAPHAYLVVTEQGTNFAATFPRDPNRKIPARWRQEAMHVAVKQGAFTWQLAGSPHQWSLGGLQLGIQLLPAWLTDAHEAQFVVDPGTVVNHAALSTGMCQDVLKFIAPVLSNATTADGSFSLALAGGTIPFDHLRDAQLQGVLTLHAVNIGPGEWLKKLASVIKLPSEVNITRESAVKFEVAGQRVHHSGLEFGSDELYVRTSGSVGFDESLDLLAEVQLHLSDATAAKLSVLQALNNRVLRLPIKGTFKHPEFDWGGRSDIKQGLLAAFQGTIPSDAAAKLPDQLQASGILSAPSGVSSAATDLGIAAGELIKQFAERRRERKQAEAQAQHQQQQQEQQPSGPPPSPDDAPNPALGEASPGVANPGAANPSDAPPTGTSTPPKRGALGRVLRAVVEAAAEAAAQPDSAPDAAPAASSPSSSPPPASPPPAAAPAASPPPAAEPEGPSLSQPTNGTQAPGAQPAAANPSVPIAPAVTSVPAAPRPPVPAAVPPLSPSTTTPPPPPLLSTPLPAAPFQPSSANPAPNLTAKSLPADDSPRRPLGRALRALVEAAGDATPQSAGPQAIGSAPPANVPAGPGAPPVGPQNPAVPQTPPAADANSRRPVLRRLFRAALDAAVEAASQPPAPATPQPPTSAPPAGETLPAPAPAPAPAPE